MNRKSIAFLTLATLLLCQASFVQGSLVVAGQSSSTIRDLYIGDIVNNDLIDRNNTATYVSDNWDKQPLFGPQGVNDGTGAYGVTNNAYLPLTLGSGGKLPFVYTVTLNTSVNNLGYDISEIHSFGGWDVNGRGLADQAYEVLVKTVGSSSFTSLGNVSYVPFTTTSNPTSASAGNSASKVVVTDGSGKIASGVSQIQFIFKNHGGGGNVADGWVCREVDVLGAATVPEPSTLVLLTLASLGFLALVRRKRS